MLVGVGQLGLADRGAVIGLHDPLGQEKVPEQGGHQEILSEQLLKCVSGQRVPGYRVCDRGEDPVELSKHRLSVLKLSRNLLQLLQLDLECQCILIYYNRCSSVNCLVSLIYYQRKIYCLPQERGGRGRWSSQTT